MNARLDLVERIRRENENQHGHGHIIALAMEAAKELVRLRDELLNARADAAHALGEIHCLEALIGRFINAENDRFVLREVAINARHHTRFPYQFPSAS